MKFTYGFFLILPYYHINILSYNRNIIIKLSYYHIIILFLYYHFIFSYYFFFFDIIKIKILKSKYFENSLKDSNIKLRKTLLRFVKRIE